MTVPDDIFEVPYIFPEKLDLSSRTMHFCEMDTGCFRESSFLDDRIVKLNNKVYCYDIDELLSISNRYETGEVNYIFHNAFCCSTLFSRCLNAYQSALILREPHVLYQQSSINRYSKTAIFPDIDLAFLDSLSDLSSLLMSRKYPGNDVVIVKPTDACNISIEQLMDANVNNKCLLMYSDIERFLTAIFKYPERANFMSVRANELCLDEMKKNGKMRVDPESITHPQRAALVWVLHMERFREVLSIYTNDRVQVLNSEIFMKDQVGSVVKYLELLHLNVDVDIIKNKMNTTAQSHSKVEHVKYGHNQREAEYQINRKKHARDIDAAIDWVRSVFGNDAIYSLHCG